MAALQALDSSFNLRSMSTVNGIGLIPWGHLDEWKTALVAINSNSWMPSNKKEDRLVKAEIKNALNEIKDTALENQSNVYRAPRVMCSWYYDERLRVSTEHEARSHMISDLHRYMYASSHVIALDISPKLNDFPEELLPSQL